MLWCTRLGLVFFFFPCSSVAHGPCSLMLSNAYLIFVCSR